MKRFVLIAIIFILSLSFVLSMKNHTAFIIPDERNLSREKEKERNKSVLEQREDRTLRPEPDRGAHGLAVFDYDERRNTHDAEAFRKRRFLIDVDLADLDFQMLTGYLLNDRREHFARTAPDGEEIQQDGLLRM